MCIVCLTDSSHTSTHLVWLQSARVRACAYVYYCPCPVLCCCGRHASRVQSQTIPSYYRTKHSAGVARLTASLCGLYSTPLHSTPLRTSASLSPPVNTPCRLCHSHRTSTSPQCLYNETTYCIYSKATLPHSPSAITESIFLNRLLYRTDYWITSSRFTPFILYFLFGFVIF